MTGTVLAAWRRLRGLTSKGSPRTPGSLVDASVWSQGLDALSTEGAVPLASQYASGAIDPELAPILGEFAWHSLTADPRLLDVSEAHYGLIAGLLTDDPARPVRQKRALEIAAYAHVTGYMLHDRLGVRSDVLDISPSTLRLGRGLARDRGLAIDGTRCVAGDFHALPYEDEQFDLVYICSALHHTWRWQRVVSEMLRVLVPGGILFLENEPCRRLFCHYRFRANRPERFGDLEQALDRLGILRTVAEPFPSTRPESLFGMVENQTIPIHALFAFLATQCSPVAVTVDAEVCMGPLEHELVARIGDGAEVCTRWLAGELGRRVDEAGRAMTKADRGMGFGLPSPDEIAALCKSAVQRMVELPSDQDSPDFRLGVADIFGAAVQLTLRKKGRSRGLSEGRLREEFPVQGDVVCAFPSRIARLLDARSPLVPDIQSSPLAVLEAFFPPRDWRLSVSQAGLRDLSPSSAHPEFTIPVPALGPLLVLVRLYVAVEDRPFRIALWGDGGELAGFDAYRADSLLLAPVVQCAAGMTSLRVSIRTVGLGAAGAAVPAGIFTLSYAGAFAL